MANMTTHMSMQAITMRMTFVVSISNIGLVCGGRGRGMLTGASHSNTGFGHGIGDGDRVGVRIPPGSQSGRAAHTGVEEDAGTSRFRRRKGGRQGDGGSSSDTD